MGDDDARSGGLRVHTQAGIVTGIHLEVKGAERRLAVRWGAMDILCRGSHQLPVAAIIQAN